MDGFIDCWDYMYRQNEVAYSYKVSDNPLSAISVSKGEGKMLAVGDSEGSVTMIQLCKALYEDLGVSEKDLMISIFEREGKREKNLEQSKNQSLKGGKPAKDAKTTIDEQKREEKLKNELIALEEFFFDKVGLQE